MVKILRITMKSGAEIKVGGIEDVALFKGAVFGELRRVEVTYTNVAAEELHWLDVEEGAAIETEER